MYGNEQTAGRAGGSIPFMQLHEFLTSNSLQLINRCREKTATRFVPTASASKIDHGVTLFLQQLTKTLRDEDDALTGGIDSGSTPALAPTAIARAAALHGVELLRLGFSVEQVVHDYGDICQSVTGLAVEQNVSITTAEFRTLNRCLDDAIAGAVASFAERRQASNDLREVTGHQRLEAFTVEHRRLIDIAIQSLAGIQTGSIGISGATGTLLAFALQELRALTDRSLPEILATSQSAKAVPAQ
jgi:hypothetical protein